MTQTPAETRRAQQDKDMEAVLETPQGRRVLWRILHDWGRFMRVAGDEPDARIAALLEGRRIVGASLWTEAQRVSPELHALMVREALAEEQAKRELALAEAKD